MSTSTTDGTPSICSVCGKTLWLTPSECRDATCPHCGALLWFDSVLKNDAIADLAQRGVTVELDSQGEVTSICFAGDEYDDSTIASLAKIRDVKTMDLRETMISSLGVRRLRVLMPNVKIMYE